MNGPSSAELRPAETPPSPRVNAARRGTPARRLWADKLARWSVSAGGLAIIASILGIMFFILLEVLPLILPAGIEPGRTGSPGTASPLAVLTDEHRTLTATLDANGRVFIVETETGALRQERQLSEHPLASARVVPGQQHLSGATDDGRLFLQGVDWRVSFVGSKRQVQAGLPDPVIFEMDPSGQAVSAYSARLSEDDTAAAVAALADGSLVLARREVEENFLSGEMTESWTRETFETPAPLAHLLMDGDARNLYGATVGGEILWWRLGAGSTPELGNTDGETGGAPVSAMSFLIGDRSVIVGREDGSISVLFPVRREDGSSRLQVIRRFPGHGDAVRLISPSLRDKGFLIQDEGGILSLYHSTSERTLWSGASPEPDATSIFYSPKADGAVLAAPGSLSEIHIDNPHPEISLRSLFGKVWYEGYPQPEYVWQSSGGTDDAEPKLSLIPLIVGTLKGTVYSLILAVPLAVLGAMYTSHFTHPTWKRVVKPSVEIMAALPSVVLGFLAGLWLAPRLETVMPGLFMMALLVPLVVLAAGFLWEGLPRGLRNRLPAGSELVLYMIVILLGAWFCLEINPGVQSALFGESFANWLNETLGLRYDQRNAIVVGLAMGFAVIPIIFSIAEDAFSNVPRNLVSGSLALGANRWQTVTRVVLPTASPGIFSAIMIGFGRAVGETMIVLMATGNTPILDWNPFNGFRTLSANIAVEIPEAPHGATLYRTLFLAALLLFIFTFLINTVAELVRSRLRKRYAQI